MTVSHAAKGERKMPTNPLLREIRRNKSLRGSKFSLSGNIKKGGQSPAKITLRRAEYDAERDRT